MTAFDHARHFFLLTCAGSLLAVVSQFQWARGPAAFAIYGALHGSALVAALRSPTTRRRRIAFVAVAASLSQLTLVGGLSARGMIYGYFGSSGIPLLVTASASIGAIAYGIVVRLFWLHRLPISAILVTSLGCGLAALLAVLTSRHSARLGGWWLAVLWWFSFSGGLMHFDRDRTSLASARVREH